MTLATGTASSFADLYAKLIAFLTGSAMGDERWRKVWTSPTGDGDGVVLSGPGLAGLDNVLVGLDLTGDKPEDVVTGRCWMTMRGMTGVNTTAVKFTEHVNVQPQVVRVFLDTGPMSYWFIANGRRFILVVKISTVFQSGYAGLFLPYATPVQYPYPMFVGGMAGRRTLTDSDSWRSVQDGHAAFTRAWSENENFNNQLCSIQNALLSPSGEWISLRGVANGQAMQGAVHPNGLLKDYFAYAEIANQATGPGESWTFTPDEIAGYTRSFYGTSDLPLTPLHLIRGSPNEAILGILDGCYKVSGFQNASENVITIDGANFLTVQNAFRTNVDQFHAVALG